MVIQGPHFDNKRHHSLNQGPFIKKKKKGRDGKTGKHMCQPRTLCISPDSHRRFLNQQRASNTTLVLVGHQHIRRRQAKTIRRPEKGNPSEIYTVAVYSGSTPYLAHASPIHRTHIWHVAICLQTDPTLNIKSQSTALYSSRTLFITLYRFPRRPWNVICSSTDRRKVYTHGYHAVQVMHHRPLETRVVNTFTVVEWRSFRCFPGDPCQKGW